MAPTDGDGEALEVFEAFLRKRNLKMTEPRRTLVRAALAQAGHFTAEDFHERLRDAGERVSLATVYRSLALLEESGILEGHDFEDGQRRFEKSITREHHDHLICIDCRAVVEFQNESIEALQEQVLADHGFRMVHHALTIFAACQELARHGTCRRRAELEPATRRARART